MTEPGDWRRRAIEGVARHVGADPEPCDAPSGARLTLAGRRIAVEIATGGGPAPDGPGAARLRLRDDRLARRVLADLEAAVAPKAPAGRMVILTLEAPIRLANRTLAALTESLLDHLGREAAGRDERMDILGNRVRFRIVEGRAPWTSALVGFVFGGGPSPGEIETAMRRVHDEIVARATAGASDPPADARWLVLARGDWIADAATYRRALSRLALPEAFERILRLSDDGRVETLAD